MKHKLNRIKKLYLKIWKGDLLNCYSIKMCQCYFIKKKTFNNKRRWRKVIFFNQMVEGICKALKEEMNGI